MVISLKYKRMLCGVLTVLMLMSFLPKANAASSAEIRDQIDDLEDQAQQIQAQMDELEAQLADNLEQMEQMVGQKDKIDQQIFLLNGQIANTNQRIAVHNQLLADNQEALTLAQQRLAELRLAYKARIRAMEEAGTISYWSVLFQANSFADFLDRMNMIWEIAEADHRRMQMLTEAAQAVEDARQALESQQQTLKTAKNELQEQHRLLDEKRKQADELLQQLMARETEYLTLLETAEVEEDRLLQEIADLEEAFDEAKYQEWLASYIPPAGSSPSVNTSGWGRPVASYRLTSPFGMRDHPILGYPKMHNGVDLSCPQGTHIFASRGGRVSIATYHETAGYYVKIDHGDGYASVYMHMTNYVVSAGQYVAQGQLIGYVGNTGLSKGAHLHFGISLNGTYVNPMEYIS